MTNPPKYDILLRICLSQNTAGTALYYTGGHYLERNEKDAKLETKCLHAGYTPKNGEPRVMPIVQSTTYVYDSTNSVADVFDDPTLSLIYSRFENPTTDAVEKKIAALEGGAAAMCTSSGQAASLLSILNICEAGDSFIASSSIYGGTINLFGFTLKKWALSASG